MKFQLGAAAIALFLSTNACAASRKPPVDANAVMANFQQVMAASAMQLNKVERHHDKIMKKVRTQLNSALLSEGEALGVAVSKYTADMAKPDSDLADEVGTVKAVLAQADKGPQVAWDSPLVMERAQLSAKTDAAGQFSRASQRKRNSLLMEAERDANDQIENHAAVLGRELGDLSETISGAESTMKEKAEAVAQGAAKASVTAPLPSASDDKVLGALGSRIVALEDASHTTETTAQKALKASFAQIGKTYDAKIADMTQTLKSDSDKEMKKLRGGLPKLLKEKI